MLIPTPARALDDELISQTIHRGHAARRGGRRVAVAVAVATEQRFVLARPPHLTPPRLFPSLAASDREAYDGEACGRQAYDGEARGREACGREACGRNTCGRDA